jgi:hypothetical protein
MRSRKESPAAASESVRRRRSANAESALRCTRARSSTVFAWIARSRSRCRRDGPPSGRPPPPVLVVSWRRGPIPSVRVGGAIGRPALRAPMASSASARSFASRSPWVSGGGLRSPAATRLRSVWSATSAATLSSPAAVSGISRGCVRAGPGRGNATRGAKGLPVSERFDAGAASAAVS